MKRILSALLLVFGSIVYSQSSYPLADDQIRSEMSASERSSSRSDSRATFGITTGYAGFKIDDASRQGFDIDVHALVSRFSQVRVELNGGVVLYNSSAGYSEYSSTSSPYLYQSNAYSESQFTQPRFNLNFALAYIGTDALYYFSEGKVRPYVAAGIKAVTWQMSEGFAGTLVPSARGGIEIDINHSFSGFAEARYMYGMPNILNQYVSSLKYVTSVAFGVSFAPQL